MGSGGNGNPVFIRYGSLAIVVLQTTVTVLLLRYSRTRETVLPPYLPSTAVLSSECCKFVVCVITLFIHSDYSLRGAIRYFQNEIICKPRETAKLLVPAGLYAMQNNLLYLALSNLDAATYQVTYQLKILTTALFSVCLLRKQIQPMQWISLLILTIGVALVQLPANTFSGKLEEADIEGQDEKFKSVESNNTNINEDIPQNPTLGLMAVLTACFSSGLAGVYFEMLVKTGAQTSIVIRNLQLGLFSLVFATMAVMYNDANEVLENGFFQGYDGVVILIVLIQAFGGLVVAVAVKYADNILKVFATSISIILSSLFSYLMLNDMTVTGPLFLMGTILVIAATVMYGHFAKQGSSYPSVPSHVQKTPPKKRKSSPVANY